MQVNVNAERPAKTTKLAIIEEREEDKYEHVLALRRAAGASFLAAQVGRARARAF
jgi:hypothetical protein